ncbi:BlaI/MecI/CopY family transcriptional regulator [Raineyella sp. LH-20]|uniref:BlaI/MecI/CopY family transcriptional regulator n=1 Tax=Raineyella sp. LH-20 TaxID=3081204 RepID=UPI0029530AFB|nr:BlaI/MecI/CopY family transcriptional regulator [Raineyella sp. LH-20]WOP19748.1 BlaI/MecI/CopY family transcriptional regulator [Raineyella sp. LH-20]
MPNLGDLELQVMEVLWRSDHAMSVREVLAELTRDRDLAYTTVMTVLDRLAKKDRVTRDLDGRAWYYRPAESRATLIAEEMRAALVGTSVQRRDALREFVDGLDHQDAVALAALLTARARD